jgi:ribonuclease HI
MYDPHALKLYIDGSAYRNPGHEGGYSVYAEYPDEMNLLPAEVASGTYGETTNNGMELRACIEALRFACAEVNRLGIRRILIITDSLYIYDNQKRAPYWKKDDWRNREGRPVENPVLWNEFLTARPKVRASVEIIWQEGKTTPILKETDKSAKKAAHRLPRQDFGYRKGRVARTKVAGGAITMYPAAGQKIILRVFKCEFKDDAEWKISFDVYSPEAKQYVAKYFAYLHHAEMDQVHRHHCYLASFNENPQYPIIEALEPMEACPI